MKFKYRSVNFPTGYDSRIECQKRYDKKSGVYFISINNVIHFYAVCDDFGNLVFA